MILNRQLGYAGKPGKYIGDHLNWTMKSKFLMMSAIAVFMPQ